MTQTTKLLVTVSVATATVALAAGCSNKKKDSEAYQDPFFPTRESVPASETIFKKQFALGAAEDSMLFPIHFDGDKLNSLGKQKVDAIFAATPVESKPNLYLNLVKDDAMTAPRQASVEAYLKEMNVPADTYAVAVGPNPSALRPAAAGVEALGARRLEMGDASVSATSNNLPVVRP